MFDRWRANPEMYLRGARLLEQFHNVRGCSPPNDAVIDNNQSFASQDGRHRIEFLPHTPVPALLFRFYECPSDVPVSHEAVRDRYP